MFISLLVLVIVVALGLQISQKPQMNESVAYDEFSIKNDLLEQEKYTQDSNSSSEDNILDKKKIDNITTNDDCIIAGCNNQVCTDQENYTTDCRWHKSYGCYEKGVCERQNDGECGWTRTNEIMQCLMTHIPELAYQFD